MYDSTAQIVDSGAGGWSQRPQGVPQPGQEAAGPGVHARQRGVARVGPERDNSGEEPTVANLRIFHTM